MFSELLNMYENQEYFSQGSVYMFNHIAKNIAWRPIWHLRILTVKLKVVDHNPELEVKKGILLKGSSPGVGGLVAIPQSSLCKSIWPCLPTYGGLRALERSNLVTVLIFRLECTSCFWMKLDMHSVVQISLSVSLCSHPRYLHLLSSLKSYQTDMSTWNCFRMANGKSWPSFRCMYDANQNSFIFSFPCSIPLLFPRVHQRSIVQKKGHKNSLTVTQI